MLFVKSENRGMSDADDFKQECESENQNGSGRSPEAVLNWL